MAILAKGQFTITDLNDGTSLYTWIKYADSPTSGMSDSPTGKAYMGVAYNKTTPTKSSTYADYQWTRILGEQGPQGVAGPKGETGATGSQGIQGPAGADGKPTYTWVKYALDQYGNGLWDIIGQYRVNEMQNSVSTYTGITVGDMENRKYIGLAHNKTTAVESTNKADYQWSLIAGEDGITYYTWYAYADDVRGSGFSFNPDGKAFMGVRFNALSPMKTENPDDYEWVKIKGENGSDANVPAYIKDTYIDSTIIKSPTIQGNVVNAGVVTGGYIKGTIIEGGTISGVNINGSNFESRDTNGGAMTMDGGRIKFTKGSASGYYDSDSVTLFGGAPGRYDAIMDIQAYVSESWGVTGSIITAGNSLYDFAIMNPYYQNGIHMKKNGNVYIDTPSGDGNISISSKNAWVNNIWMDGQVEVNGSLAVSGDKNSIVPTQHYGVRALYADESDRCYFSTKGLNVTINNECIIELDPIFMETIELNSTCPYIILLTPYSDARVWIEQVDDHRFIVRSDKDTKFAYDLKATRISYENVYLDERNVSKSRLKSIQQAVVERRNR